MRIDFAAKRQVAIEGLTVAFTEAIERGADNPGVWAERGNALVELGRWKEAAADFAESTRRGNPVRELEILALLGSGDLAACPKEPKAYSEQWVCLLIPGAVNDYKRFVAQMEEDAKQQGGDRFFSLLGAAYYRPGKYDLAVEQLRKAAEHSDSAPLVWCLLAMAYHRQGKPAEGRHWLDKAVRLKSTDMPEWWSEISLTVV